MNKKLKKLNHLLNKTNGRVRSKIRTAKEPFRKVDIQYFRNRIFEQVKSESNHIEKR